MVCHEPTGKAGRDEDSLYTPNGVGPFCEQCWDDAWPVMVPAAPDPARLADIAAAERLARAANIYADEEDEYWRSGGEPFELEQMANEEYSAALAAYRARMAQGVGDAE